MKREWHRLKKKNQLLYIWYRYFAVIVVRAKCSECKLTYNLGLLETLWKKFKNKLRCEYCGKE